MRAIELADWLYKNKDNLTQKDIVKVVDDFAKSCVDIGIRIQTITQGRINGANKELKRKRLNDTMQATELIILSEIDDCMAVCDKQCKVRERVNTSLKEVGIRLPERYENALEVISAESDELVMRKR